MCLNAECVVNICFGRKLYNVYTVNCKLSVRHCVQNIPKVQICEYVQIAKYLACWSWTVRLWGITHKGQNPVFRIIEHMSVLSYVPFCIFLSGKVKKYLRKVE